MSRYRNKTKRTKEDLPALPRGGAQKKKTVLEKKWVHPDAREALTDKIQKSVTRKNN